MGTLGRFVRERIEAVGKQQKVLAAEVAEAVEREGARKVEPSTVETKLSKIIGESSWGEGHRFFLEDPVRRRALASALAVSLETLEARTEAAREEEVILLDPTFPPDARAYFDEAAARLPGKFRLEAVGSGVGAPSDAPRVLREAAARCDRPLLVLTEATAMAHAGFFEGADLRFVVADPVRRGWRLRPPYGELVPLPPPPGPRLVDEDGNPMVVDAELVGILRERDRGRSRYDRPEWFTRALAGIERDLAEERQPTVSLGLVVDHRLQQAVESSGATYAAEWSGEQEAGKPGEWFQVPSSLGDFERRRLEEYRSRRRNQEKERAELRNRKQPLPEVALLEKALDPATALYWRHQGILYRLGQASTDLGLPAGAAPRSAQAGVAFLTDLPSYNFARQDEPGFLRFKAEAVKAAEAFGIDAELYFEHWTNERVPLAAKPFHLEAAIQVDLVREARQELEEFCHRDGWLEEEGLDGLDILARAARAPLRVLTSEAGLRMVRADLGGGRIADVRFRRFAKTPKMHLVGWLRRPNHVFDGGDLEVTLGCRIIRELEGPFLAARASRERAESDDDYDD